MFISYILVHLESNRIRCAPTLIDRLLPEPYMEPLRQSSAFTFGHLLSLVAKQSDNNQKPNSKIKGLCPQTNMTSRRLHLFLIYTFFTVSPTIGKSLIKGCVISSVGSEFGLSHTGLSMYSNVGRYFQN